MKHAIGGSAARPSQLLQTAVAHTVSCAMLGLLCPLLTGQAAGKQAAQDERPHFSALRGKVRVRGSVQANAVLCGPSRKVPKALIAAGAKPTTVDETLECDGATLGLPHVLVTVAAVHSKPRTQLPNELWRFPDIDQRKTAHLRLLPSGRIRPVVSAVRIGRTVEATAHELHGTSWTLRGPRGASGSSWSGRLRIRTMAHKRAFLGHGNDGTFVLGARSGDSFRITIGGGRSRVRWYVHLSRHPLFALTDSYGKFELPALPKGRYELKAWHPRLGQATQTLVVSKKPKSVRIVFRVPPRLRATSQRIKR